MLNYVWAVMMAVGILWGALHGRLPEVTNGALEAAGEAVTLGITMLGVMSFWTGILEIGQKAGLIGALAGKMYPVLRFLFPKIPKGHPALESISANMIANMLGLGWAATPAGLKAMGELEQLEEERRERRLEKDCYPVLRGTASNEMCTFLIINISSLQLIPINMIAYRAQYGSANPAAVTGPALLATGVSTLACVLCCTVMNRRGKKER